MRTHLFVAALILGLLQAVSPANAHGDDPGHKHQTVTEQQAIEFARVVVAAMVREKAVEESWNKAKLGTASKKKKGRAQEWVVTFTNAAATDPTKRTLHVFLDREGEYLAANFTGR
jgi:hypothetical protein